MVSLTQVDSKTEFLIIGSSQQLSKVTMASIKVGDCDIQPLKHVRNLGTWFDNHMSMNTHIGKVCSKAFRGLYSGAPRAKRACGAPWVNKSTHPRKFGNHVTDRPTDRPSTPQAYQCLLSHFLVTLGAQEKADCASMLSSIDSCQNRVSADHYHLTVSRAQVSTHQGRVFF